MGKENGFEKIIPTSIRMVDTTSASKKNITVVMPEIEKPEETKTVDEIEIVDAPLISLYDCEKQEYPFSEDDENGTFTFTGLIRSGKVDFVMNADRKYRIPNRYHTYYGIILENEATEIFKVKNAKEEILEKDGTKHYLMDKNSQLEYIGGEKYTYTIDLFLDHVDAASRVRMITISAAANGYVHFADGLFGDWANSMTEEGFEADFKKQKPISKKSYFKELFQEW